MNLPMPPKNISIVPKSIGIIHDKNILFTPRNNRIIPENLIPMNIPTSPRSNLIMSRN